MACDPLVTDPFEFPRRAYNRPGLPRIAYRIGRYPDFVEAMTRAIDAAPELAAWTHRDPDDPGIALLQGAAILGDILSFYQEHYANEAYLRTAAWRESVADLVRLTGYRLVPGIGGRATLAFEVRGEQPVTIRQAFPARIALRDVAVPADFQTDAELTARPRLGRFHLYRPRRYPAILAAGATAFELASVDGAADTASLATFDLKAGERLLLQPHEPAWADGRGLPTATQAPQLVKVRTVTRLLGRVIVEIDAPLRDGWQQPVQAWRINRAFRHFGHNAPSTIVTNVTDEHQKITGARQSPTLFERHLAWACYDTSYSPQPLPATLLPLDADYGDLRPGMRVLIQAQVSTDSAGPVALCVARTVRALETRTIGFGNLTGSSALLTLDRALVAVAVPGSPRSDVRTWRIDEVTSPPLMLQPVSQPPADAFSDGREALAFYGTAREAQPLAGRRLWLSSGDSAVELVCANRPDDFASATPDVPQMWPLSFDRKPAPFVRADFDEAAPGVTVYGNLADASQGKAERDEVLGNGDNRQSWQTFALPKAPLTYFLSASGMPPYKPELDVRVDGQLWSRVDTFFGQGPAQKVYIVREDADGRSYVQFGDGETGARLPSGLNNVVAAYRTGVGARGPLKQGATPSSSERPPGFDKLTLAGIVSGGADAEDGERAREAAPGKVQSLGRLVSIRDYETETLALPGVVVASAAWDLHRGVPAMLLRVLLVAGREAEFAAVRDALNHAQRCRGPDRFALVVEQARLRYAFADVSYQRDPVYGRQEVEDAMRAALGIGAASERSGLFRLYARRLGQPEYASRIEGLLQNVPGVAWCRVGALGLFAPGLADPAAEPLPPVPRPNGAVLPCAPQELLQLAAPHLTLTCVATPSEECA
jgi:hypothetical protein